MKTAKLLRENGSISDDIIVMFDEIYIQKSEEYQGGESFGADEDGGLYKGMLCFMIHGLKSNIPYVIHSVPEIKISGELIEKEAMYCIETLQEIGFKVRGICCDNHPSNVSAYDRMAMSTGGNSGRDLKIYVNDEPIYLFYDTVHLMKNVRNNLLARKRFLFPPFENEDLGQPVRVAGGEVSWSLLHRVHEEDSKLQSNLRAAPRLTKLVLHPGTAKQSVPVALSIFEESTVAAILKYFPRAQDSAEFLTLFHKWWIISNSKMQFNSRDSLGNAAVKNDGKPAFLRSMADWIEEWTNQRMPNCQNFTLSAQTSAALTKTLRCHACLIEDLLEDGFKYVRTAGFQSDPLEKRYGQYRQMSGGRFLISAKDVHCSENILKIKSLVKEGFDIDSSMKQNDTSREETDNFLVDVEACLGNIESIELDSNTREVSDNIAGFIVRKAIKLLSDCCINTTMSDTPASSPHYIAILSRGKLITPSHDLGDIVAKSFAVLDASNGVIKRSKIPSRRAGLAILNRFINLPAIACEKHKDTLSYRIKRTVCNCFFSARCKRSNEKVKEDHVASLKRPKRQKNH